VVLGIAATSEIAQDTFSLGMIICQIFTIGCEPLLPPGPEGEDLARHIYEDAQAAAPGTPIFDPSKTACLGKEWVSKTVRRMLSFDPAERPTIAELVDMMRSNTKAHEESEARRKASLRAREAEDIKDDLAELKIGQAAILDHVRAIDTGVAALADEVRAGAAATLEAIGAARAAAEASGASMKADLEKLAADGALAGDELKRVQESVKAAAAAVTDGATRLIAERAAGAEELAAAVAEVRGMAAGVSFVSAPVLQGMLADLAGKVREGQATPTPQPPLCR